MYERRARRAAGGSRAAVVVAALALAGYAAMHSPLRKAIADVIGVSHRGCYLCARGVSLDDLEHALAAGALVVLAVTAAWIVARRFGGAPYETPLVFGLALLAFSSVPAAAVAGLASLADGHWLRPPGGPLLAAVPAFVVCALAVSRGSRPALPRIRMPAITPLLAIVGGSAAVLTGAAVVVSLLHPPMQGDALTYHLPIAVHLWSDGNLTAMLEREPREWVLAHPGTAELWYGLLRLLGGERLADLGQLPFALLGAAAAYAFTRRTRLGSGAATLAAAAFLLTPVVALQLATQANDVAAAALLMTAIALAVVPGAEWTPARALAVGAALGLTAVTKLALLPGVAIVGLLVVIDRARGGRTRADLLSALAGFAVVVSPWWIRNIIREGNPVFPQSLPILGRGVNVGQLIKGVDYQFVPKRVAWPVYPFFEPIDDRSGFGPLVTLAAIPGLIGAWGRARRRPFVVAAVALAGSLPFWWKYTLHEPRFLLAYVGLAAALVPWTLVAIPRRRRRLGAGLVAAAAVFALVISFDQGIIPTARFPTDRAEFYDRVFAVDPFVVALPDRIPLLQVTGYGDGGVEYAATYPLLGPTQGRRLIELGSDSIRTSADVVRRMHETGIRYAYATALPRHVAAVSRLFPSREFRLIHFSRVAEAQGFGARRHIYRPVAGAGSPTTISRWLFLLTR